MLKARGDIHIYSLHCIDQNVLYDFCLFLLFCFQMKFTLKQIMRVILEFSIVEVLMLLFVVDAQNSLPFDFIFVLCFLLFFVIFFFINASFF